MKLVWDEVFSLKSKSLPYLLLILSWVFVIFLLDRGIVPAHVLPNYLIKENRTIIKKEVKVEKEDKIPLRKFVTFYNSKVDPNVAIQIEMAVEKYAKQYNLPKRLVMGIIKKESTFYPLARSKVAGGLMQVYPKYHKEKIEALGIKDIREIFHIDNNVHLGCWIFREYLDKEKEDLDKTFHRYLSKNASEKEKREYINDILLAWGKMEMMEQQSK